MSDRFVLHASRQEVEQLFGITTPRDDYFGSDYNITPGTRVPIVVKEGSERQVKHAQWGMIPSDADEESKGKDHYEVESEQADDDAFRRGRCIIPANGFYKWKSGQKKSTPFYIRMLSNELMAFAGIYSVWESDSGRDVYSFAMLTTAANALVQPVDNRMPVILEPDRYNLWLDTANEDIELESLRQLMQPFDLTRMAVNRVSEKVNDPTNNDPSLIQPIPK